MRRQLVTPRTRVQEIGCKPAGIARGRLAEPYDGTGQYVSVALAGSSVGSALRARVASGDFGGGRTFPAGTPVTVVSHRGNVEVFLGNFPGCKCGDKFSRVEAQGLGEAPFGIPYVMSFGESQAFVDGSAAWLDGTGTPYITLDSSFINLPLEILFKLDMTSTRDPFSGWSGTGGGIYNDFEFFCELHTTDPLHRFDTVSYFCSGLYPATVIGLGANLGRIAGSLDSNDVTVDFDINANPVELYFRFYADNYGVYARVWNRADSEPVTVADGSVKPYPANPSYAGGKGEAWSTYEASDTVIPDRPVVGIRFGSNGVAGLGTWDVIDEYCFIQGGPC